MMQRKRSQLFAGLAVSRNGAANASASRVIAAAARDRDSSEKAGARQPAQFLGVRDTPSPASPPFARSNGGFTLQTSCAIAMSNLQRDQKL